MAATIPKLTKYIPHLPTPKQTAFLLLNNLEALYGGAAGGGKSDALLMGALQYVDVPGYSALLLRRTFTDLNLPSALIARSHEWLHNTDARWDGIQKRWFFPSGATLNFGYLEHENDKYRYQSAEFQYIGFDELTQFTEPQYTYLFSRLRRLEGSDIPLRMRGASNPGGIGHEWVKRRFLDEGRVYGRTFIPATLDDNPFIDREAYELSLGELDPITRRQLRSGDWTARTAGSYFRREWFPIVDAAPAGLRTVRFWDFAATEKKPGIDPDYTAGSKAGIDRENRWFIVDIARIQGRPASVERLVVSRAQGDGDQIAIWMEQEPGSSGINTIDYYRRKVLQGFICRGYRTTGPKETRIQVLSAQAEAGNVYLVRGPWIGAFLDEAEAYPTEGVHDDQLDATAGAMQVLLPRLIKIGIDRSQVERPRAELFRSEKMSAEEAALRTVLESMYGTKSNR